MAIESGIPTDAARRSRFAGPLLASRIRNGIARRLRQRILAWAFPRISRATADLVVTGPFKGMKYVGPAEERPHSWAAKVLGTYEMELAETVERLVATADTLICIGAAEGYYAVGYLHRQAQSRAVAFEAEPTYRKAMHRLATLNGVEQRLTILGRCTPQGLVANWPAEPGMRPAVICDVEGGEMELIDPLRVPQLRDARLIVELHPWLAPGVEAEMRKRLAGTHRITAIVSRQRTVSDYPMGTRIPGWVKVMCMNEGRPQTMTWYVCEPLG